MRPAHFRGGFSRERNGENVRRLDAPAQQVEVPIDEHMRLAGACRCLEHHVVRGIDGALPCCRSQADSIGSSGAISSGVDRRRWTLDDLDDGRSSSSSNGSQLDVANVILPADGGMRATGAHHRVRWRRRKFAALDPVDRIQQPRLRLDQVVSLDFPRASIGTNCRSCPKAM